MDLLKKKKNVYLKINIYLNQASTLGLGLSCHYKETSSLKQIDGMVSV